MQTYYYRPQTKFAKVMFSQVSVYPQGMSAPLHAGIHPRTRGRHPLAQRQTPPLADTTSPSRHPPGANTPLCSACLDTFNRRVVCIPLECILVLPIFSEYCMKLTKIGLREMRHFFFNTALHFFKPTGYFLRHSVQQSGPHHFHRELRRRSVPRRDFERKH